MDGIGAAGYIPIAGNWIGQGATYTFLLSGQSLFDSSPYPASAPAFASWPSTYMSASFPNSYNESETIIVHRGGVTSSWTCACSCGCKCRFMVVIQRKRFKHPAEDFAQRRFLSKAILERT